MARAFVRKPFITWVMSQPPDGAPGLAILGRLHEHSPPGPEAAPPGGEDAPQVFIEVHGVRRDDPVHAAAEVGRVEHLIER